MVVIGVICRGYILVLVFGTIGTVLSGSSSSTYYRYRRRWMRKWDRQCYADTHDRFPHEQLEIDMIRQNGGDGDREASLSITTPIRHVYQPMLHSPSLVRRGSE